MTEEQIVKNICEIMGVKYSHYDNHNMEIDYFPYYNLKSKPKIVVYSGMSPWKFAILEDMSVITPMSGSFDILIDVYKSKGDLLLKEQKEMIEKLIIENDKIKLSEEYLKDNNCSEIINDVTKKINWV